MPQMSPLYWFTLFIYFTLIFIIFNISNYFIFNYKPYNKTESNTFISPTNLTWKW
uniref:ATP synthase complex subunit 8 n=1 Tax=Nallachius americanus TaxID=560880 RepID=A0A1S5QY36_9NEOP|nr:ATP synthase F0 subunit 8 [Nallachius americanus]